MAEVKKVKVYALKAFFNDAIGRTVGKGLITEVPATYFKDLKNKELVKEASEADIKKAKKYQKDYILEMNARRQGKTIISSSSDKPGEPAK